MRFALWDITTEAFRLKSPLGLAEGDARGFPVASGDAPNQIPA